MERIQRLKSIMMRKEIVMLTQPMIFQLDLLCECPMGIPQTPHSFLLDMGFWMKQHPQHSAKLW